MSIRNYIEIDSELVSEIGDETILVTIENTSLSKFKTISIESDSYIDSSVENENDSFTMLDENTAVVCLQPFTINCDGVPSTSETFVYNTNGTYRITINGITTVVRGNDLKDFFSQNKISMVEIVE